MRRTWLVRLGAASVVLLAWGQGTPEAYVLAPGAGEVLERASGKVVIKASPRTGSSRLAVGTQTLRPGAGIGVHRHPGTDEVLIVQKGNGTVLVNGRRLPVDPGAIAFVPAGAWHGVENAAELEILWIVSPPGLDDFFRETAGRPMTRDQMAEIARKHGTIFSPPPTEPRP